MSESRRTHWDIDTEIGLIINQVALELNVSTKVVKTVMATYYKNISIAMQSDSVPKINIAGLASVWPAPNFIKCKIAALKREDEVKNEKTIQRLTEIYHREKITRNKKQKND